MDDPRDELIQLMSEDGVLADQLKVLSIVGFGGLGKTKLANEIYCKLKGKFQCRVFVSVSQKPNMRDSENYTISSWLCSSMEQQHENVGRV
jgi:DNA-binding transcriptional regulator WhiA